MKNIGIIGGLGPEATVDYYQRIIEAFKSDNGGDLNYPEIIIYSVNMKTFIGCMKKKQYREATDYLVEKIRSLERAGADFVALSANTPHQLFDDIKRQVNVPILSIVEATYERAQQMGLKRLALFGTLFTMNATFFADVFENKGIQIIPPDDSQKAYIHEKLFSEIELGIFKEETRTGLIKIMQDMHEKYQIDGVILGCTELPLILPESQYHGLAMLNTTEIHVKAIVEYCRA
ncbi:MAG: amino acid racemase [Bacteroidales bacterium]|nr:amino acid racemase [Bacteroidales bacterium]HOK99362.1 amino acid racemase [Bacteroidales bacterium]HPO66209.1 amino acid racemase [Bacteroidales bacterium]